MASTTLTRPRQGAVIAGVCAGLAERFGWSPFAVRLVFLLSCLLPGPQFIVYLVLWVIMPRRPYEGGAEVGASRSTRGALVVPRPRDLDERPLAEQGERRLGSQRVERAAAHVAVGPLQR